MVSEEVKQLQNETPDQYRIRLYRNQTAYGLTNQEIGELLNEAYGLSYDESAWRKKTRPYLEGYDDGLAANTSNEELLEEIRKEKLKLQTLNVERNRIDRKIARQELFYEQLADQIPKVNIQASAKNKASGTKEYVLTIADIHYGYQFVSMNNSYSPEIAEERMISLSQRVGEFCKKEGITSLKVINLGDNIHGILRVNDLHMNQAGVVSATIGIAKLLGKFIEDLAAVVNVDYYHVPESNHTQIRPLGTKASEIASEDVEYIITEFLKVMFAESETVKINTAVGDTYIDVPLFGAFAIAKHGHDIKNIETANKDLAQTIGVDVDFLFLGHFHNTREYSVGISPFGYDRKTFLCPSIMGSDPYADKILRGSSAGAELFEFDSRFGHTGTKHFVL